MAGSATERRIRKTNVIHVDLQTGTITGVPYIETVRGIGKNGLPFRALPGQVSQDRLDAAGAQTNTERKVKEKTRSF